jgi:DNA-binding response OmpR family regulator
MGHPPADSDRDGRTCAGSDRSVMLQAMARILIVDDEPHIIEILRAYLVRDGHSVATLGDGAEAVAQCLADPPDLMLLDVMLPGRSGFDVLRELRTAGSPTGIIMLTARDDLIDRVAGLEIGADDYIAKPFEPREVVARVGAVLRRLGTGSSSDQPAAARTRIFFDLTVDRAAREVRRDGPLVELTRVEFDLLWALVEHPGMVLGRGQLGELVFGESFEADDRTMDSHVKNLRHKLGPRPDGDQYIQTVRGVGYRAARP